MAKQQPKPGTFAGVDVSSKELVIALVRGRGEIREFTLPNTPEGHKVLLRALAKKKGISRVALEATGNYHLDLALTLAAAPNVELMVVNPAASRWFARAQMTRAKTDKVDARALLEFCMRMPFEKWVAPSKARLHLRAISRYLAGMVADQTVIKNRIAAASATDATPAFVLADLQAQLTAMEARILTCQREARLVIKADAELEQMFTSVDTIPGIGERTGVLLLGELAVLDKTMTPDEIVAHAGLDPRPMASGMRDAPRHISKVGHPRLRAAMYMPALAALRDEPNVKAWYESLKKRGKPTYVAIVAVMRRVLRVAWVIMIRGKSWNTALFAPRKQVVLATTTQEMSVSP